MLNIPYTCVGQVGDPQRVLPVYLQAIDHVFAQQDGWKRLRTLVKELSSAFALAVPRPETEDVVEHVAFFQRVAAMIRKRLADESSGGGARARQRDVDAAVRQVIGGAVNAGEVIDLFAAAGLDEARLDILSDEFLNRVAALEQKNLALETLRKLLADQIRITERTNIIQSKKFREALEDAMLRYTNKAVRPSRLCDPIKIQGSADKARSLAENARGASPSLPRLGLDLVRRASDPAHRPVSGSEESARVPAVRAFWFRHRRQPPLGRRGGALTLHMGAC